MRILAVETCLGACSAALLDNEEILARCFATMERGHAEALAPMVEEAMHGVMFATLDRLAVTVGPGTFTGQRVGLSFMRGLRLALQKPLLGVTSLEAMALAACEQKNANKAAAIHDARRGEVYLMLWKDGVVKMAPRVQLFANAVETICEFGPCALVGTGAPAVAERLGPEFALSDICQPDALFVARLARTRPDPGALPPAPLYLRTPDARLPGDRDQVIVFNPAVGNTETLAALHAAAFDKPWDSATLADLLANPGTFAFVATSGFVLARAVAGEAEILTLAVALPARGRGLGRALMQAAATHAGKLGAEILFLEVETDNSAALALYGGLGFTQAGVRKAYYDNGSQSGGVRGSRDALVLKAALPLAVKVA